MRKRKNENPFLEYVRYYEVPKDKLPFILDRARAYSPPPPVHTQDSKAAKANSNSKSNLDGNVPNSLAESRETPSVADHFEHSLDAREGELQSFVNGHSLGGEEGSAFLTRNQSFLSRAQSDTKGLLHSFDKAYRQSSVAQTSKTIFNDSGKLANSQGLPRTSNASLPEDVQSLESLPQANVGQEISAQNISENFIKGSLRSVGVNSEQTILSAETALGGGRALITAAQRLLQAIANRLPLSAAGQELFLKQSAQLSEGDHLLGWGTELGVPAQLFHKILPLVAQFQEMSPPSKTLFQGLMLLFGTFSGLLQQNNSNLSWMLLKGVMILETQAQMNQVQSPLLDELGALLSTSRRRLRREAKKRMGPLNKVSRKDSCLADMDAQETAPDDEALIDLWPKKESNNTSMSFYY